MNILSENTRVILPVQSGKTPHYVVLQSHNGRIVTCCNGGMVEKHSYKKLFRLHKNVKINMIGRNLRYVQNLIFI